jgi:hypothetical protein
MHVALGLDQRAADDVEVEMAKTLGKIGISRRVLNLAPSLVLQSLGQATQTTLSQDQHGCAQGHFKPRAPVHRAPWPRMKPRRPRIVELRDELRDAAKNSAHPATTSQMRAIDPKHTFKMGPMNER